MKTRSYSPGTILALKALGTLIQIRRRENNDTALKLAERAGVSRGFIHRVEKGDPRCEIGVVFEIANLLGIPLISQDIDIKTVTSTLESKLAIMPQRVRTTKNVVSDDF